MKTTPYFTGNKGFRLLWMPLLKVLLFWGHDISQGIFTGEKRDLLLETLNRGEKFEDHQKNKNETSQDDGVDVAFDANKLGEVVREGWKHDNNRHPTPNKRSGAELHQSLSGLMAHEFLHAFIEHVDGDEENDELVDFHTASVI